jgi:hypothetical protein
MEVSGQFHAPVALEKEPPLPNGRVARWGPRVDLDVVAKKKKKKAFLAHLGNRTPVVQPAA